MDKNSVFEHLVPPLVGFCIIKRFLSLSLSLSLSFFFSFLFFSFLSFHFLFFSFSLFSFPSLFQFSLKLNKFNFSLFRKMTKIFEKLIQKMKILYKYKEEKSGQDLRQLPEFKETFDLILTCISFLIIFYFLFFILFYFILFFFFLLIFKKLFSFFFQK